MILSEVSQCHQNNYVKYVKKRISHQTVYFSLMKIRTENIIFCKYFLVYNFFLFDSYFLVYSYSINCFVNLLMKTRLGDNLLIKSQKLDHGI